MQNMSRLYAIKDSGSYSGWTTVDRTSFVISVKGDMLTVTKKSGRDMYPKEINTAFGRFLQEYEQEFGEKVALYERSNPYRFCFRTGSSGCQDTFIEIDTDRDGFPQRKFMLHQSCFGKCEGFSCFAYDFLDLCVAEGFFGVTEDGFYVYREEEDSNSECEIQTVKPRLLAYEEGWNSPWQKPDKVVPLRVCREVPQEDEVSDSEWQAGGARKAEE